MAEGHKQGYNILIKLISHKLQVFTENQCGSFVCYFLLPVSIGDNKIGTLKVQCSESMLDKCLEKSLCMAGGRGIQ